jgi:hypothetical protein
LRSTTSAVRFEFRMFCKTDISLWSFEGI